MTIEILTFLTTVEKSKQGGGLLLGLTVLEATWP